MSVGKQVTPACDPPEATFVLPTRNRKDVLMASITAALGQDVAVEVIVLDDGSTDGTPEKMAERFPSAQFPNVRYFRFERGGNGPCVLRNLGTAMARSRIVFPVDDDSVLSSPKIARHVIGEFSHPRVAAVAIPVINLRRGPQELYRAPDETRVWSRSEYLGASHALRRDLFLGIGGYVEEGFYTGEEFEMSLRLLSCGYIVRSGTSAPIFHQESLSRNTGLQQLTGAQNTVYLAYRFIPGPVLPIHMPVSIINRIRFGLSYGNVTQELKGIARGFRMSLSDLGSRCPVSVRAYTVFRLLRRNDMMPLEDIEGALPPMQEFEDTPVQNDIAVARALLAKRRRRWMPRRR